MKNRAFSLLASIALLSFASCTDGMQELANEQSPLLKQIVMTTQDFQPEAGSRTIYQIADGAVNCTWAANDTVGVFPDKGAQAYFPMASGAGTKNATFDGEGWALKDGRTYGAYYPFVGAMYLDRNAVPVSYIGQTQTGNASMEHLGAYDYMVATPTAPEFGSAQFMFKHISALVHLKLTIPQPATLTSVKLVADTELFAVKGKVDIMADTPSITAVTSAKNVKLDLQDVKTTEANQVVTLYMMLPPTDLSTHTLKAVVASDKGNQEIALESKNFQAGKAYALSGSPESGEIVGDSSYKDGVVSLAEAGTMKKLLGKDYLSITSLKVVGPINGDDVYYLRKMMGGDNFSPTEWGKLTSLDLSDARIVEGGGWYYEVSSSTQYYTVNDEIGRMFYGCAVLKEIVLPDGVTSIGSSAFYRCEALTTITIGDGVTSIGSYAFANCNALTSIDLPDNVTSIGNYAFYDCDALTTVTNGNGVTSIGNYTFYSCDALTTITIGDDVTSIGSYAFAYCSALTYINIPDNVISIGSFVFAYCSALTTVTIGDGVTSISHYAFRDCSALTTVTIGDGVTTIVDYAFYDCDALTSVYIKDLSAWCRIMFSSLSSNPMYYGAKLYLDNKELTELVIPEDITGIKSGAFYGCKSIVRVVFPDNVTSIGSSAFCQCDALTTVTFGDGVTSIGSSAFSFCDALTTINFGDGVTSIDSSAFSFCYALTTVDIPDNVISIGDGAFNFCNDLTTVTIGDGVTSIGSYAFRYCSALTTVTIGDGVTSIGDAAFGACSALTDFYCHATTPPSIAIGNYYSFPTYGNKTTLHVPERCRTTYKSSDWGSYFNNIVEMD